VHWYGRGFFQPAMIDLSLEGQAQRVQVRTQAELRPVLDRLEAWMRVLGYTWKDIFAVTLALREAAANAFRHGNRGDQTKVVQICYLVTGAEALVEVQDQGSGFDPGQVLISPVGKDWSRRGGTGLFLMCAYTSWVAYNFLGNRVTLCRQRQDP
jgi:serine/threonine-protein kinase RsbW